MQLTKNFTFEELTYSSTAELKKIPNVPDQEENQKLRKLCETVLQPIRDKFGAPITVTSGFRSKNLNKVVGGTSTSQHLKGEAADIVCGDNKRLWDIICEMLIKEEIKVGQLIDEKNLSWIHISLPDANHYNEILHL